VPEEQSNPNPQPASPPPVEQAVSPPPPSTLTSDVIGKSAEPGGEKR
jgi:hypothetical protein